MPFVSIKSQPSIEPWQSPGNRGSAPGFLYWPPLALNLEAHPASNYNLVPRLAVLLVNEQRVEVMEWRETYDDLLARYRTM